MDFEVKGSEGIVSGFGMAPHAVRFNFSANDIEEAKQQMDKFLKLCFRIEDDGNNNEDS